MADTKRIVTCPACDKEMTKVFMENENINVDICLDGCGGILFNNRELEKFDEQHENADKIFEAYENKTFNKTNEEEVRICTVCNSPMVKQGAGVGDIKIDICNTCGAKFLDYGELEKIRELKNNDYKHQAKVNSIVDAVVENNPVVVGGKIGDFARNHIKTTGIRYAFENFISNYLANK